MSQKCKAGRLSLDEIPISGWSATGSSEGFLNLGKVYCKARGVGIKRAIT